MAEKEIGYIELEWTCKRCGTKNPGTVKTCSSCGSPMEAGESFEMPAEQVLITDQEKLAAAEKGADIHCPYCGTRNPAGSGQCAQCGGDLKSGQARQHGTVLGAFQPGKAADVPCPSCATLNPANAPHCKNCGANLVGRAATLSSAPAASIPALQAQGSQGARKVRPLFILIGILLCIGLAAIFVLSTKTTDTAAAVQDVHWQRSIHILEERPAAYFNWEDQLPSGSEKGACSVKLRTTQEDPAPGAEEVCGTPYTVDEGSGVAKVVQDCVYNLYDNWCEYSVDEWQSIDQAVAQGSDLQPAWPALNLGAAQREGEREEQYQVRFIADEDGRVFLYRVDGLKEFAGYTIGSRWNLKVNTFGDVLAAEPR